LITVANLLIFYSEREEYTGTRIGLLRLDMFAVCAQKWER